MKKAWMCDKCETECIVLDGDKFCVDQEKTPCVFLTDSELNELTAKLMAECAADYVIALASGKIDTKMVGNWIANWRPKGHHENKG